MNGRTSMVLPQWYNTIGIRFLIYKRFWNHVMMVTQIRIDPILDYLVLMVKDRMVEDQIPIRTMRRIILSLFSARFTMFSMQRRRFQSNIVLSTTLTLRDKHKMYSWFTGRTISILERGEGMRKEKLTLSLNVMNHSRCTLIIDLNLVEPSEF